MSLKRKTISNIKWSFVESMSLKAISFALGIILARLLLPEDFGLLAVVNVFYLLVTLFVDGGLKEALIQKKDAQDVHYSTVFWLNLATGILLYMLLFVAAPVIETYYEYHDLAFYIRLQSLTLIIESFGIVQIARATKELNLKKITKARIPASLISFGVGIFLAFHGYGILSLIVQQLVNTALYVIFLMLNIRYKPQFLFDMEAAKTLYSFGLKILSMALISRFFAQSFSLIYAKFYTPHLLGLNNKATTLQAAPIEIINATFLRGLYPSMVFLQDNTAKLRTLYLTNINMLTYIMLLINGIFFFNAEEIILLLLGKNWIESVVYLKIITAGSLFYPIANQSQNIFKVRNLLNTFLKIEFGNKVLLLLFVLIMVRSFSYPVVLSGVVLINMLISFGYLFWISKNLNFSFPKEMGAILLKVVVFGAAGYCINWFTEISFEKTELLSQLVCYIMLYSIAAIGIIAIFDRKLVSQLKEILIKK